LSSSIAQRHASNAGPRCSAEITTTTLASRGGTSPSRWTIAHVAIAKRVHVSRSMRSSAGSAMRS